MRRLVCICALSAAWAGAAPCGETPGGIVLTDKDIEPCPIFHPRGKVSPRVSDAARMLAQYLSKMSGDRFGVSAAPEGALPERAILVGDFGVAVPKGAKRDAFLIRTQGQHVHVVGKSDLATGFAAAAFLEMLGCRWWSHTEEDVPAARTIRIGPVDRLVDPVFHMHDIKSVEAQSATGQYYCKSRCVSSIAFTGNHTLYPLLTPHAQEHPEIYPMDKNGTRKGNNLHFCYVAPGIDEALAAALEKEVEKRKGDVESQVYFAGMGDWYGGMCECPRCREIYEEEAWSNPDGKKKPGYTGTLLRMINRAAEILEAKHPGILVGTFAYMSLEAPPGKTVPRGNVAIWMPHLRSCIAHGVDGCAKNRDFLLNLQRWCQIAQGRVYIWDYGVNFGENFLYPFPVLNSMARNIRAYARMGAAGDMIQGNYVSTGGDLVVLKNYVWSRLMWEPDRTVADLLGEFCKGYYGPAAEEVRRYVEAVEKSVEDPGGLHFDEFVNREKMKECYLTDDLQRALRGLLDKALENARGKDPYERRVREALASLEAFALWHAGPLEERDGWLVRTDIGANTWERAQELIRRCREASPREWGGGESYRRSFLKFHGGPVITLRRGRLAAKVAPVQSGRIRSLAFDGIELLSPHEDDRKREGDAPVLSGGMQEEFSVGYHYFLATGAPTAARVEMEAEAGIAHWGADVKQVFRKTVEFEEDGRIRIVTSARNATRDAKYDRSQARPQADYLVGTAPGEFTVEVQKDGGWTRLDLANAADHKELAGVTGVRLTQPKKGVTIVETYRRPVVSGRIAHHREKGILMLRMVLPEVNVATKERTAEDDFAAELGEVPRGVTCIRQVQVIPCGSDGK